MDPNRGEIERLRISASWLPANIGKSFWRCTMFFIQERLFQFSKVIYSWWPEGNLNLLHEKWGSAFEIAFLIFSPIFFISHLLSNTSMDSRVEQRLIINYLAQSGADSINAGQERFLFAARAHQDIYKSIEWQNCLQKGVEFWGILFSSKSGFESHGHFTKYTA